MRPRGGSSLLLSLAVAGVLAAGGCHAETPPASAEEVLSEELEAAFRYFWEQASTEPGAPRYGLVRDRQLGNDGVASIAATGFGLSVLPIGVSHGWVGRSEAAERARRTLQTLLALEHTHGFLPHFIALDGVSSVGDAGLETGISSVDNALLLAGALTAGAYFGAEAWDLADRLYRRVDWPWFVDAARAQFYMYWEKERGFGNTLWSWYAEQLMLYVLAGGSPTHPPGQDGGPDALQLYNGFTRHRAAYKDGPAYVHGWINGLFIHQYTHGWVDFRRLRDRDGVNWHDNAVAAARTHHAFALERPGGFATYDGVAWGHSACDSPSGYRGDFGAPPSGLHDDGHKHDGTIPPYAALASVNLLPTEALAAAAHYRGLPELWGRYGFVSAYNLAVDPPWFSQDVIGIDKGVTALAIENHLSGLIWETFGEVPYVVEGLAAVGLE